MNVPSLTYVEKQKIFLLEIKLLPGAEAIQFYAENRLRIWTCLAFFKYE